MHLCHRGTELKSKGRNKIPIRMTRNPDITNILPTNKEYPEKIKSKGQRALFDSLGKNEKLTKKLDRRLKEEKPNGWRKNKIKTRKMKYVVREVIGNDEKEIKRLMHIIYKQKNEY